MFRENRIQSLFISILTVILLGLAAITPAIAQTSETDLTVEADESLKWLRVEKQYIATGNAIARQGGMTLKAEVITAHYVEENETGTPTADADEISISLIIGDKNAEFTRPGVIATADRIEYNLATEQIILTGGNPKIDNNRNTLEASESLNYDRASRLVTAIGNAELILTNGRELRGDRIEAVLNEDETDFITIMAKGKAEVISPGVAGAREGKADHMIYDQTTGIANLTGNVTLKDNTNIMTGDKAVIDTVAGTSTLSSEGGRVGGVFTKTK
ncbi:LptA/OstA family protein [Alphaproteobacteria bacterium LSUCC0684]